MFEKFVWMHGLCWMSLVLAGCSVLSLLNALKIGVLAVPVVRPLCGKPAIQSYCGGNNQVPLKNTLNNNAKRLTQCLLFVTE